MLRTIAICPAEFPGVTTVFKNGDRLGLWQHVKLGDRIPLDTETMIIDTWINNYKDFLGKPQIRIIPFLTSTIGQMEFSWNQIELKLIRAVIELMEKNIIQFVLAGWPDVIDVMFPRFKAQDRAFFCPYPLDIRYSRKLRINKKIPNSIGLFSPSSARKNLQNQILAGSASGELHTNLNIQGNGIKNYPWIDEQSYYDMLNKLKITLHCGFTESFCYAAAESLMCGTIPIVSLQIAQNLGFPEDIPIIVRQVDSANTIKIKVQNVLNWNDAYYVAYVGYLQTLLTKTAEQNLEQIKIILDKVTK